MHRLTPKSPGSALSGLIALAGGAIAGPAGGAIVGGAFAPTGDDVTPRFFHRAGLLPGGLVMVSGGMALQFAPPSLVSLAAISFFDSSVGTFTGTWNPAGGGAPVTVSLSTARSSHTQTVMLDGRVLFTGGYSGANGGSVGRPVASAEIFDPATGEVCAIASMAEDRAAHTASLLPDGRVVVAGGGAWQVFEPGPDRWSASFALERSRISHAAVVLPDHQGPAQHRVLLIGGSGSGPDTLELLDPDSGSSALLGPLLAVGVDDLAAAVMDNGSVLIVGGQDVATGDTVGLSYRCDPKAATLTPLPPPPGLPAGVADHQLVGLGRYAALLGGEQQVSGIDIELAHAALFDDRTSDWIDLPDMGIAHDDAAAVLLPDRRILVVDGGASFLGQEIPTPLAELFTAATGDPADVSCDGVVDVTDLILVIVSWGPCCAPPRPCAADVDGDGLVAVADLILVVLSWSD